MDQGYRGFHPRILPRQFRDESADHEAREPTRTTGKSCAYASTDELNLRRSCLGERFSSDGDVMRFGLNGCTWLCCLFCISAGLALVVSRAPADEAPDPDVKAKPEAATKKKPAQAKKDAATEEDSPADEPAEDLADSKPEKGKPAQEKSAEEPPAEAADKGKTPPPNPTGVTFS
ncbi:MAG TPA: hypothetical protein VGJ16_14135, partial [Pirellulales bacterium]